MGTSKGWFVDNWTRMNAENADAHIFPSGRAPGENTSPRVTMNAENVDAEIIPSLLEAGVRGFFNDSFLIGRG
jgi:hypothetical protein